MGLAGRRKPYGRNDFEKDRHGITYHNKGAASCSIDDIEAVLYGTEIVSAPACACGKGGTVLCGLRCRRLGGD